MSGKWLEAWIWSGEIKDGPNIKTGPGPGLLLAMMLQDVLIVIQTNVESRYGCKFLKAAPAMAKIR
jgi:hypothetical protein